MNSIIIGSLIFLLIYGLLMSLYVIGWKKCPDFIPAKDFQPKTKISILVPARDEAENIKKCLRSILDNHYPETLREIIVIDDFSSDDTAAIATDLLKERNGKVLRLKDYLSPQERPNAYKKKALSIAIEAARGDLIVTTDADCICPESWLHQIAGIYEQTNAKFIMAPVSFIPVKEKKGWLYYFQSLDFMTLQGITAAGAGLKTGSMCNGANLAFEKEAFHQVDGYKGIDQVASGDDMLLMYKIKKQFPASIHYLKTKEAIVKTPCQPTLRSFFNQRIRWASKSDKYDDKLLTLILLGVYLFNVSLLCLFALALFRPAVWFYLLGMLLVKTIVEIGFLLPVSRFYDKRTELLCFPLLQPFHILYILSAGFLGKFGSYQWKGRKVH
ncbi:MAG TPA: glycosyltransferase [Edaphocola sp.]|nr:glycosyltransferase [Edaphocola sp.]